MRERHPSKARYFSEKPNPKEGDTFHSIIVKVTRPLIAKGRDNIFKVTSSNQWYEDTKIEPTTGTQPSSSTDTSQSGIRYTGQRLWLSRHPARDDTVAMEN